jgi:Na+-driven multidrug efflux pump
LVLALSIWLIPTLGYIGAAISASVAYTVTGLVVIAVFRQESKLSLLDFIPQKADFQFIKNIFRTNK